MKALILKKHFDYAFIKRMFQWHIKYYIFNKATPVSAGVLINNFCNCRCIMCNIWKNKKAKTYPIKLQKQAIDLLARHGCYYYSVSGGEPTLVKDLPERLKYAAQKIPYVHLVTNGLTMTPELARSLGNTGIKELSISIDGTKKFHDTVRGIPNAYDKAMNAIETMLTNAPNVNIVINSILTPYNLNELIELQKTLKSFSSVYQKYLPITFNKLFQNSIHDQFDIKDIDAAPYPEINSFIDQAIKNPKVINSQIFLYKAKLYFKKIQNLIPEQKECFYPYHSIEMNHTGEVFPCQTGMNFKNGFTLTKDIFYTPEYTNVQKKLKNCHECNGSMMLCYYEPRLNFPVNNLLKSFFLVRRLKSLNN